MRSRAGTHLSERVHRPQQSVLVRGRGRRAPADVPAACEDKGKSRPAFSLCLSANLPSLFLPDGHAHPGRALPRCPEHGRPGRQHAALAPYATHACARLGTPARMRRPPVSPPPRPASSPAHRAMASHSPKSWLKAVSPTMSSVNRCVCTATFVRKLPGWLANVSATRADLLAGRAGAGRPGRVLTAAAHGTRWLACRPGHNRQCWPRRWAFQECSPLAQ